MTSGLSFPTYLLNLIVYNYIFSHFIGTFLESMQPSFSSCFTHAKSQL